jgi:hypothetical protein
MDTADATIESLADRLDPLESEQAIRLLCSDYCTGFDRRDARRFLAIWWDDAIWNTGSPFVASQAGRRSSMSCERFSGPPGPTAIISAATTLSRFSILLVRGAAVTSLAWVRWPATVTANSWWRPILTSWNGAGQLGLAHPGAGGDDPRVQSGARYAAVAHGGASGANQSGNSERYQSWRKGAIYRR